MLHFTDSKVTICPAMNLVAYILAGVFLLVYLFSLEDTKKR